jgi:riboflavin synthase
MFSGIVTAVGAVRTVETGDVARRIVIGTPAGFLDDAKPGDSIAIDGACLTVVELEDDAFAVDAIGTTLSRTTVGDFTVGRRVNLERALRMGDRLDGHLVQGHVDGTGSVVSVERMGEQVLLDVTLPPEVAEVTVLHGSLTIDGVSLTVNALPAPARAQVALIPYTWEHTNLSRLEPGAHVNLEGDMLGRFVVHYLKQRGDTPRGD